MNPNVTAGSSWKGVAFFNEIKYDTLSGAHEYSIERIKANAFSAYLLPYKDYDVYKHREMTYRQKIEQKGKANYLSREEINREIKNYIQYGEYFTHSQKQLATLKLPAVTIDDPIWKSDGNNYLHVFTYEPLEKPEEEKIYTIGNATLFGKDIGKQPNTFTVYKAVKETNVE